MVKAGKFDELRCILQALDNAIHILIVTETWIKTDDEANRFQIPNYTHYYNHRTTNRGGGVSMFVRNDIRHAQIEDTCIDGNHFLWVHLQKYSLNIGAIYRKPSSNAQQFLDEYSKQICNKTRTIVIGDFNFNLLSTNRETVLYNETLEENGYRLINKIDSKFCTRETDTTRTIIDHICTNLKEDYFHQALIQTPMSDHNHMYLEMKKYVPPPLTKTQYEAINYKYLYEKMQLEGINNKNKTYDLLEERIINSIKSSRVTKYKILNPPRRDWINRSIIEGINKRNSLWKQYKKNPKDEEKELLFKTKRNEVSVQIQSSKRTYYLEAFRNCKKKPSKMWKLINTLSSNKTRGTSTPSQLRTKDGAITTNVKEMCECFNDFFVNVGSELAKQIPNTSHHTHYAESERCAGSGSLTLDSFTATNVDEISRIIDNLDCNTSAGLDNITTKSIKCIKNLILTELTNCINQCMQTGVFPNSLKVARVSPIYKSGSKLEPGNYRPISVLPVMSKIYERVIYNRLEAHITSINFMYDKQYGFRPKSNTLSATIDLVTNIKLNIDKKQLVLGVFIDLKKAFDTVSHELLLKKLNDMGLTGAAYDMLKSYLSNRMQVVQIGKSQSSLKPINFGVPQGSILGPLLFTIYINNISKIGLTGDVTLYADDTCLFYSGRSINDLINQAQKDLDSLNVWFQRNLLTINISKSNYIIFASKNKNIENHTPLNINNISLNRVEKEKYLGLYLDSKLTWRPHIQKIKAKITSLMGMLRGIVRLLPLNVRHTIYSSLVRPHFDYLIELWGAAAKTNLSVLQISQNKLLKVLFNYDYLTPTTRLYKELKTMKISQIFKYFTCILIRKILNKDIHTKTTFTKKPQIHKMRLRKCKDIDLYSPRTNYGKRTIMYEGSKMYNNLPKDIKESKSLATFKRLLKNHILNP